MIMSRMDASLSVAPSFEQIRLLPLELATESFHTVVDVLPSTLSIFQEEGQTPASVERNNGLNDMVPIDDRLVIRRRELKDGFRPQFHWISEVSSVKGRDSLQFRKRGRRKDRNKNRF